MNAVAQKTVSMPIGNPQEVALWIKQEAPRLADLAPDQLEIISKMVIAQRLSAELNTAVDLAGIDWQEQRETFLSDCKSLHTRRVYNAAIGKLEAWIGRKGLNPLAMTAAQADQYIRSLKEEGRAPVSIRRDIAAVSAFYTFLERNTDGKIKNPVRGTRLRPPNENKKEIVIPSESDFETIMANVPAIERAILAILALRGLRAGALPTLELKAGRYYGMSKGKKLMEGEAEGITFPDAVLDVMKAAGLNKKKPFAWKTRQGTAMTATAIESRINKHIGKLYREGKIRATFSCHDFRHFFAVQEYKKNKDIFRLSKLLNHTGIQITQTYLKSLEVEL
jgi:site-specific recombinase XerD